MGNSQRHDFFSSNFPLRNFFSAKSCMNFFLGKSLESQCMDMFFKFWTTGCISNFGFEFWFTIRLLSAPFMVIFIVRRD